MSRGPRRTRYTVSVVDPDTSDESMSYSAVDTSTSEQQDESFKGTSQRSRRRSLNFESSPDFVAPRKNKIPEQSTLKYNGRVKKSKGKNTDPDFMIETSRKARSQRNRVSQSLPQNSDNETRIYFLIKDKHYLVDDIVDDWIDEYIKNREGGLLILIQFFIDLTGCKGRITLEMQTEMEVKDIISRLTKELNEEAEINYPLIKAGKEWKDLSVNICEFIYILIEQCHENKIIFDKYLLENVIPFLVSLSESKVRTFRHTATFAAMKLTTAVVDVAVKISNNLKETVWENMDERQQELDDKVRQMGRVIANMFDSVFIYRFKDVRPEIRSICMEEMGYWFQKLPQDFLDDEYLKYIGWNLHDSSAKVRLKCLQALQPLYASEDFYPQLNNFNITFKERMINMTHDKEKDVAVEAVKIMISIFKHERKLLKDADNEKMFQLVFEYYQPLARVAGEFLNKCLFTLGEEANGEISTLEGKILSPNTFLIQDLVVFYTEASVPGHGDLLVDSLIETNEMLKDWKCMTDLLLEDLAPEDQVAESVLIELMVCCIKQAATGEIPERRVSRRKMSAREQKQVQQDKEKMTEHFIQTLPLLLSKYKFDPETLANLLTIPQYFDLFIIDKLKEEDNLQSLLKKMQMIVKSVYDSDVLDAAAKTFEYLCTEGHPNFARCDLARTGLIDVIVKEYKTTIQEYRTMLEADEEIDTDLIIKGTQLLKQIALFYMNHDLNHWMIWDSLFGNILDVCSTTGPQSLLPDEAVKYCITSCYFSLLWGQRHLIDWVDSDSQSDDKCEVLRNRLKYFMELMCNFISGENIQTPIRDALREDAFLSFCDLLVIFSNQLQCHPNPLMHRLIYTPTPFMINLVDNFLQQFVFINKEDKEVGELPSMEEVTKRRNILASYCKLIIYNMVPVKEAVFIFKNYIKYKKVFGDIIKETLIKTRDISRKNLALTIQHTLNILFAEIVAKNNKVNRKSKEFVEIKELARQFSVLFGNDGTKNRDAMVALHKAGIRFTLTEPRGIEFYPKKPPTDLSFFEILSEFTNKLLKDDKRVLLEFLDDHLWDGMLSLRGDDWEPLATYRNSLLQSIKKTRIEREEATANPEFSGKSKKKNKKIPRKPELLLSKITLPRPSSSGIDTSLERNFNRNSDDEVSPVPSIEDSSTPSIPLSEENNIRERSDIIEESEIEESE